MSEGGRHWEGEILGGRGVGKGARGPSDTDTEFTKWGLMKLVRTKRGVGRGGR